jgi:peptidoglycan/xylan/chitin deacetylase (PgdA/CDA1 family)
MHITKICAITLTITAFGPSAFAHCPDNPQALGTSRTLIVNPRTLPKVGRAQYQQSHQLKKGEVVLTFDHGPSFPYTDMILQALAHECVKATFFSLGKSAAADPEQIRHIASGGHNVGTQTFNAVSLASLSLPQAQKEISEGMDAVNAALQSDYKRAPFFRAPMLQISPQQERYVAAQGMTVWSMDVDSRDWRESTQDEIVTEILKGLARTGGGIVVMQDSQPETARALPALFEELKRRNFRIVHVIAAETSQATTKSISPQRSTTKTRLRRTGKR